MRQNIWCDMWIVMFGVRNFESKHSVVHSTLLLRIVLKRLMCELTYWKVETKIPPALLTHVLHVGFGVSRSSRYRWRACKQSDQSIRDLQFNFSSIYMYQSLCSYVLLESFNFCQILVLLFFHLLFYYLANKRSLHVRSQGLEIPTLLEENRKIKITHHCHYNKN